MASSILLVVANPRRSASPRETNAHECPPFPEFVVFQTGLPRIPERNGPVFTPSVGKLREPMAESFVGVATGHHPPPLVQGRFLGVVSDAAGYAHTLSAFR